MHVAVDELGAYQGSTLVPTVPHTPWAAAQRLGMSHLAIRAAERTTATLFHHQSISISRAASHGCGTHTILPTPQPQQQGPSHNMQFTARVQLSVMSS